MAYDCVIIGLGPAGLTAALFTGRANLKTLVIGQREKSQLWLAEIVQNAFGVPDMSGPELLAFGISRAVQFGCEVFEDEVVSVVQKEALFVVKTAKAKEFEAKTVIICSGTSFKTGGVRREKELTGKGVHYCVYCDGYFYRDKTVAVVGNANYAAEEALQLSQFTKKITMYSQGKDFTISPEFAAALKQKGVVLSKEKIVEFQGDKRLSGLLMADNAARKADGAFVAIGTATALSFAISLGLEVEGNTLKVNQDMMTNVKGVFAAGSCIGGNVQIAKGSGDGCNAAIGVIKFLTGKAGYVDHT